MKRVGDMDGLKQLVSVSKRWPMVEAGITISEKPPTAADIAFMAVFLVQCTLPHSDPGDLPIWTRRNGGVMLAIQQGYDLDKGAFLGYPYGSLSRLLLLWIVTEVVRTKSRRLELGNSLAQFMAEIGLSTANGTGKRSDVRRLRDQMRRLFGARITFQVSIREEHRHGEKLRSMEVAPESELWWDPKRPDQGALWGSWIEVGEKLYDAIMTFGVVPFDLRHIAKLRKSPLALDLYMLLNYLGAAVGPQGHKISWSMLMQQMGCDYTVLGDFRRKALEALTKVTDVHRGLNVKRYNGGVHILPSKPAVPRRSSGFVTP